MPAYRRSSTLRVKDGRVQRKNRSAPTPNYFNSEYEAPVIDRKKPGKGFCHLLRREHVRAYIQLLPDWQELSSGLNAIVLDEGDDDFDGWHHPGIVGICAWERELWRRATPEHHDAHKDLLTRLNVPFEKRGAMYLHQWTAATARAYQLLHVLLHELGHHHDRMTTRSQARPFRGEGYAEAYAHRYEALIWGRYFDTFGVD